MQGIELSFSREEYAQRLATVRQSMAKPRRNTSLTEKSSQALNGR